MMRLPVLLSLVALARAEIDWAGQNLRPPAAAHVVTLREWSGGFSGDTDVRGGDADADDAEHPDSAPFVLRGALHAVGKSGKSGKNGKHGGLHVAALDPDDSEGWTRARLEKALPNLVPVQVHEEQRHSIADPILAKSRTFARWDGSGWMDHSRRPKEVRSKGSWQEWRSQKIAAPTFFEYWGKGPAEGLATRGPPFFRWITSLGGEGVAVKESELHEGAAALRVGVAGLQEWLCEKTWKAAECDVTTQNVVLESASSVLQATYEYEVGRLVQIPAVNPLSNPCC